MSSNQVKTTSKILALPALLLVGLLAMGFGYAGPSGHTTSSHHARYSGTQIYRGVFFGEGQVGALFPETRPSGLSQQATGKLISRIKTDHPGFFDHFRAAMTSGDPVTVRGGIDQGRRVGRAVSGNLDKLLQKNPEFNNLLIPDCRFDLPCSIAVGPVVVVQSSSSLLDGSATPLSQDMSVTRIVNRLGPYKNNNNFNF